MSERASTPARAITHRGAGMGSISRIGIAFACALALAIPVLGAAQVSGDTARGATTAADSLRRAAGDSGAAAQPGAPVPTSDRVPPAAGPGSTDPTPPSLPIRVGAGAPPDTTLLRACAGVPGGREAPGLLAVVFRTGTIDRDRVAAAKAVGGTLGGRSAYGEEYVRLEVGSGPLSAVADRLIRQDPVVRVSPAPCPPEAIMPPPAATNPADSARAGPGPAVQSPAGPLSTPRAPARR